MAFWNSTKEHVGKKNWRDFSLRQDLKSGGISIAEAWDSGRIVRRRRGSIGANA
jgi:hypothetical protein